MSFVVSGSLPFPKFDLQTLPATADPTRYIRKVDWNGLCQAVDDLRVGLVAVGTGSGGGSFPNPYPSTIQFSTNNTGIDTTGSQGTVSVGGSNAKTVALGNFGSTTTVNSVSPFTVNAAGINNQYLKVLSAPLYIDAGTPVLSSSLNSPLFNIRASVNSGSGLVQTAVTQQHVIDTFANGNLNSHLEWSVDNTIVGKLSRFGQLTLTGSAANGNTPAILIASPTGSGGLTLQNTVTATSVAASTVSRPTPPVEFASSVWNSDTTFAPMGVKTKMQLRPYYVGGGFTQEDIWFSTDKGDGNGYVDQGAISVGEPNYNGGALVIYNGPCSMGVYGSPSPGVQMGYGGYSVRCDPNGVTIGNISAFHTPNIISNGAAPSASLGTAAGTGASWSISGTDMGHLLTITTAGSPAASSAPLATVTFGSAGPGPAFVTIEPANSASSGLAVTQQPFPDANKTFPMNGTGYALTAGNVALATSTAYKFWVKVQY